MAAKSLEKSSIFCSWMVAVIAIGSRTAICVEAIDPLADWPFVILPSPSNVLTVQNLDSTGSLYAAFRARASVYECLVERRTSSSPMGELIEHGQVELKVSRTIFGLAAKRLTLPYSVATGFVKSGYSTVWPESDDIVPGKTICVIVVPGAIDDRAAHDMTVDGAACYVLAIRNNEVSPGWVKQLSDLSVSSQGTEPSERRLAALSQSLTDANENIRRFAVDALLCEFSVSSPDGVIRAARGLFSRGQELSLAKTGEADHILRKLRELISKRDAALAARKVAVRLLALLSSDKIPSSLRDQARVSLAAAVSNQSFSTSTINVIRGSRWIPFDIIASEVLSAEEIISVRTSFADSAENTDIASAVSVDLKWLDVTK